MVHCGSRGLGHQTCTDYLHIAETHFPEITAGLADSELAYLPAQFLLPGSMDTASYVLAGTEKAAAHGAGFPKKRRARTKMWTKSPEFHFTTTRS